MLYEKYFSVQDTLGTNACLTLKFVNFCSIVVSTVLIIHILPYNETALIFALITLRVFFFSPLEANIVGNAMQQSHLEII